LPFLSFGYDQFSDWSSYVETRMWGRERENKGRVRERRGEEERSTSHFFKSEYSPPVDLQASTTSFLFVTVCHLFPSPSFSLHYLSQCLLLLNLQLFSVYRVKFKYVVCVSTICVFSQLFIVIGYQYNRYYY
jgi:hypothetical protein